jgi:hypothetical protein
LADDERPKSENRLVSKRLRVWFGKICPKPSPMLLYCIANGHLSTQELLDHGRMRAELWGEAFNLTNTPLFGDPGTVLNTPTL